MAVAMSAEIVVGNEDLLTIILSKLPARHLLQFKLVSKQWHALISSSRLALLHFNPSAISGLFFNTRAGGQLIPLRGDSVSVKPPLAKLLHISQGMEILHSCNGLLLCGDTRLNVSNDIVSLYLYNPTLGWYIQIPSSEGMRRDSFYGAFNEHYWNLAFDPVEASSYKIIHFSRSKFESSGYRYSIEIYSSETGLWKLVNNDICSGDRLKLPFKSSRGVLLNGKIFWPAYCCQTTLCFDVAKESIKSVPMPPYVHWVFYPSFFVESGGHLYYIGHQESKCLVHEMEDSCSGWLLKYSVDVDAVLGACPSTVRDRAVSEKCPYLVLSFIHGEDQKDELVIYIAGCAVYYDINQMSCRKICDVNAGCFDSFRIRRYKGVEVHKHIESLITLPGCRF